MRVSYWLLFLTLVVSPLSVDAAPQTKTTVTPSPYVDEEDLHLKDQSALLQDHPEHALITSVGFAGGPYLKEKKYLQGPFLSFRYAPLERDQIVWDYNVEVHQSDFIGLGLGRRWYRFMEDSFRPYARASLNTFLEGSDALGGLVELRRWRLRGSLGVGEHFTTEVGVGWGLTGGDLFIQWGYNWLF